MATATAEKKVRVVTTGKLEWKFPQDLTEADHAWLAANEARKAAAEPVTYPDGILTDLYPMEATPSGPTYPDYSRFLSNLRRDLEKQQQDERDARNENIRYLAASKAEQLKLAITNAEEAQRIPATFEDGTWVAEPVQFDMGGMAGIIRIPPAFPEFELVMPPIRYTNRRWVTTNPLEIAWLRKTGMEEVPVGHIYAYAKGMNGGMWADPKSYDNMVRQGLAV